MATPAIVKIGKRAKAIHKAHPKGTYQAALKKASAEYRAGKLGGVKKKKPAAKKKSAPKKRVSKSLRKRSRLGAASNGSDRFDSKRVNITVGSISSQEARLKKTLAEKIGWYEAALLSAKTAKGKRNMEKKIRALKVKYRRLD